MKFYIDDLKREEIKSRIHEKGEPLRKIARETGVNVSCISRICTGKTAEIRPSTAKALGEYLGLIFIEEPKGVCVDYNSRKVVIKKQIEDINRQTEKLNNIIESYIAMTQFNDAHVAQLTALLDE